MRTLKLAALLTGALVCGPAALAQTFVEQRQDSTDYNWQSTGGAPISDTPGTPAGSDGRAPGPVPGPVGTVRQFQSVITFGAGVVPQSSGLATGLSLPQNADPLDLPRGKVGTEVRIVMTSARIGAPFVSRSVAFLFGAVIPVPDVDEYGVLLSTVNNTVSPPRPITQPEAYWLPEPYTATDHSGRGYYWSPHARQVFAINPGPIDIPWRKAVASTPSGSPPNVITVEIGGITYTVLTRRYVISGSAVKTPRQMYWTEGDFTSTGKRVNVPSALVGGLEIVYNNVFPERVTTAFPQSSVIEPDSSKRLDEKRTLWYDSTLGTISAYNVEGRVFLELLGDLREDKTTRQHLGFEIVDVVREPTPNTITIELGERLTAFPNNEPDDASLFPEPILTTGQPFYYQHNITASPGVQFFAARETANQNDLQLHWLEQGLAGLKWPFRFTRYLLIWPADVAKYSHYIRPLVSSEADAKKTAVPLPNDNAPFIQYQDPLDQIRGKLTERFEYYTYLVPEYPAHRALLRFNSGANVRFERVFSWLDANLRSGDLEDSVATDLSSWNSATLIFDWPDNLVVPRTFTATVEVGQRISAPAGELGSSIGAEYLAGHIVAATGDSFHPGAYKDPFVDGFETANRGAIIPINAIPGDNLIEVLWYRKNQASEAQGFKTVFWPSVNARYTVVWPTAPAEIILASNDGSGALPSLQAKGAIYYQNDPTLPGYNPNEEHALMQGGQAWALRDDLNILSGANFSSEPYALLDYVEEDGRPAIRPFKVLREKPSEGITFEYQVKAGAILQPPMPLPLLEPPFAPKLPGLPRVSLNQEFSSWTVGSSTVAATEWMLDTGLRHFLKAYEAVSLQNVTPLAAPLWFFPTAVDTQTLDGIVSTHRPFGIAPFGGAPASDANRWRFAAEVLAGLAVGDKALLALPSTHWSATVTEVNTGLGYVEVEFSTPVPEPAKSAILLVRWQTTGASGDYNNFRLALEPLPTAVTDSALQTFYASFTLKDRKGNTWVYRGPHEEGGTAAATMQFYYKILPGFNFPSLTLAAQPAVGTITPYLRTRRVDGTYVGDGVRGNADNDQVGDGNPHGITYRVAWPDNAPVLEMAETLTLPKRGLPAVRGQTSVEVLYQQSQVNGGDSDVSVMLHDPTREKTFNLGADPASTTTLGAIPDSIATSQYRGKTYFPNLPPHLVERFSLDPNRGTSGALVFAGQFVDAALGDRYLFLNILGPADLAALKGLCLASDSRKALWDAAVDGLSTDLELFVEDPGKPGTFIPTPAGTVTAGGASVIVNDDVAVDSYAMTAIGPGTGYVTFIAGNGLAFTPEAEPVSVYVIRVVNTLYRGEVNVVESSNPLNERLTLQQVVDLAGQAQDYNFEWKIAAPVDGLPPVVYNNTAATLLGDGSWSHVPHPLPTDPAAGLHLTPAERVSMDVAASVIPTSVIPFTGVSRDGDRYVFDGATGHRLTKGNRVGMRKDNGQVLFGLVHAQTTSARVVVEPEPNQSVTATAAEVLQLHEAPLGTAPQSAVFRSFDVPGGRTYTQIWLSLNLADSLAARVYLDGQAVVAANLDENDTLTSTPPSSLSPLAKTYRLNPSVLAGGTPISGGAKRHTITIELFSGAAPGAPLAFNARVEAIESVDATAAQWLPIDPDRFLDGVRAVLGGTADVRSLADNYVIMRYQAKNDTHASWVSDPLDSTKNISWSQWTSPALAEGWIKRVLKGINPFNQRVTDLFNNQVNTSVSLVAQAGPRWEGDVSLNLDTINDSGLIEIYETVLNRGKNISIGGGINYGPANDALLLAAGYLNDLYMILGNEGWADAANPTIGIGTKDNTYGDIATALFSFRGQLPSLLDEELSLLRGRDDFLLPGVELRPVYNRLIWNFTRGIDAGEVIYSLNYNILDQNIDGRVDADDARRLYPQGHGDAYGHYLTAIKGYYSLLLDPNFSWVPRIEAVTVLGKPVSVDYQDERKFAAAAAALARAGRQIVDLTWRKDYQSSPGSGWGHLSATRENATTRNLTTTRHWGVDHWASRAGQGAYFNWIVGNAILPDEDPDPTHAGSIQQVDRSTVPELKELPEIARSLQTSLDNAEGGLTPLEIPAHTIPFDLNPSQIAVGAGITTHFEQVYERAREALRNALAAFDDAKDVTRLMRSEEDSLAEFRAAVDQQERAYNRTLVELYGSPYPEDIGPGKTYATGYDGPDLVHHMYVDEREITFGGLLTPRTDYLWRIDVQTFTPDWLNSDGISDFSFIKKARTAPVDGLADPNAVFVDFTRTPPITSYLENPDLYVEYNLASHGFFQKPETWVGRRATPGRIQQAISDIIKARNAAYQAFYNADAAKYDLDWAILEFDRKKASREKIRNLKRDLLIADRVLAATKSAVEIVDKYLELTKTVIADTFDALTSGLPDSFIAGLAAGGDITSPAEAALKAAEVGLTQSTEWPRVISFTLIQALEFVNETTKQGVEFDQIAPEEWNQELRDATSSIRDKVYGMNNFMMSINHALQELDDAQRAYRGRLAEGERIQAEREVYRQRAAAVVQGFRTRDAAFRIFRNEKLERYKALFDLAAQYTYMAAQAFDYDTGLLHTQQGKEFLHRVVRSRALGVIRDGEPQFAGSDTGDPGLSSVMAEMNADWSVLKGRLGFKNPDAYGTTASLRTEHFRILPGSEGETKWTDLLHAARRANLLEDSDVRRYCMQIDAGNGLPVPGLVLEFSTAIADGLNLFGHPLAPGDHSFSPASFATKVFGIGVSLEGYKGMDDPVANGSAVNSAGASSPADPSLLFLDPDAMAANPYIYLIPVGVDSMRSPPLGDASVIRTWSVDDVAIPLPFNIGGSDFSTAALWQSSDSLTEPIFAVRKHQSFRPVSSANVFGTLVVYWASSGLQRSQYTSTRLIGRSAWNSKWKLVIPGRTLLNDPHDGLDRFIRSVKDAKIYFQTYSYAGN
ncbi:MAG: hypothetical protein L0Z50_04585 [Verrucomicrobiales bacterium]|nr:hypothetical protein [Verrucomicrobiales bacterium]